MCLCHHQQLADVQTGGPNTDPAASRDILPSNIVPSNYAVWLEPDFETLTFAGTVDIRVEIVAETTTVVLNAKELKIHNASITYSIEQGSVRRQEAKEITLDTEKETVTFTFLEVIPTGVSADIQVSFSGVHNDKMAGFYRSTYNDAEGNKKYLLSTQFESTDARQCFPCFDEPALKATFDSTLVVPVEYTALSNMNVISTVEFENTAGKKVKEVKFARTPIMSTYLVAYAVGDLEYVETTAQPTLPLDSGPITVRVYAIRGQVEQGKFALDVGAKTLEFFSKYFNIAYPLPKLDMLAVPDFAAGAMENYGLVTYRSALLLCNPETATTKAKADIASVVGHELAHQWFGNLVTMSWWNDLWLNEGFATFVGWLSTDYLFPEWKVWTRFVVEDLGGGLGMDGLRSSHPVEVEVNSAKDIMQIFDGISYLKGASAIRMLNEFLGGDIFMNGVRTYLQEFKYKNTVTADLWRHLSASSGLDIASLMKNWIQETGYPLISVEAESYNDEEKTLTVTLSQTRFLASGDLKPEEDTVVWNVPITVATHLTGKTGPVKQIFAEKQGTITFPYDASTDAFWKLNAGATGFYRVKYLDAQVASIGRILQTRLNDFGVGDRVQFLSDAFQLAKANIASAALLLNMINSMESETDYSVLQQISTSIGSLRNYSYRDADIQEALRAVGRKVFSPKVVALGYEFPESDDHFTRLNRVLAITTCERNRDVNVVAELRSRFDRFIGGEKEALHPEIRIVAFRAALSNATPENAKATFDSVLAILVDPQTEEGEKEEIRGILGAINSAEQIDRLLNEIVWDSSIIRPQDFFSPVGGLAQNCTEPEIVRPLLIQWFKTNFNRAKELFGGNVMFLGIFATVCVFTSIGEEAIEEIRAWARGDGLDEEGVAARVKDVAGFKRRLDQLLEGVQNNTNLINAQRENIRSWVAL
ncbi:peptidase family M1-domain-containing protein [Obelidium mucronatum]|nr:peptidase family M1-domain-containing protein [Obelidium mucronatum]